jgi:hypothetical protein
MDDQGPPSKTKDTAVFVGYVCPAVKKVVLCAAVCVLGLFLLWPRVYVYIYIYVYINLY